MDRRIRHALVSGSRGAAHDAAKRYENVHQSSCQVRVHKNFKHDGKQHLGIWTNVASRSILSCEAISLLHGSSDLWPYDLSSTLIRPHDAPTITRVHWSKIDDHNDWKKRLRCLSECDSLSRLVLWFFFHVHIEHVVNMPCGRPDYWYYFTILYKNYLNCTFLYTQNSWGSHSVSDHIPS